MSTDDEAEKKGINETEPEIYDLDINDQKAI